MANKFLNAREYANTMLMLLKNQLVLGRLVSSKFENQVTDHNGLTINVKKPPQFVANDGPSLQLQDIETGSVPIRVDQYKNVHIGISDLEHVENWNDLMRSETMKSAASTLAHAVDSYLHGTFLGFYSHVGAFGTDMSTVGDVLAPHTRLMNQSVPNSTLSGVLSWEESAAIREMLTGTDISGVNKSALQRARLPVMSEIDWYATNNWRALTTGTRTDGAVAGNDQDVKYSDVATQEYQDLVVDGLGANGTVKKGEIFTIAGVYAVNPRSKETLPYLQQFVVTEDVEADSSGEASLKIFPYIIATGPYQTVSAKPIDGAVVEWSGTASTAYPVKAAFHKSAIQLVTAKLATPMSDTSSFATDKESGISIRYWRGSDITTGEHIHRWDMIFGAKVLDPRLGVRVNGTPSA